MDCCRHEAVDAPKLAVQRPIVPLMLLGSRSMIRQYSRRREQASESFHARLSRWQPRAAANTASHQPALFWIARIREGTTQMMKLIDEFRQGGWRGISQPSALSVQAAPAAPRGATGERVGFGPKQPQTYFSRTVYYSRVCQSFGRLTDRDGDSSWRWRLGCRRQFQAAAVDTARFAASASFLGGLRPTVWASSTTNNGARQRQVAKTPDPGRGNRKIIRRRVAAPAEKQDIRRSRRPASGLQEQPQSGPA